MSIWHWLERAKTFVRCTENVAKTSAGHIRSVEFNRRTHNTQPYQFVAHSSLYLKPRQFPNVCTQLIIYSLLMRFKVYAKLLSCCYQWAIRTGAIGEAMKMLVIIHLITGFYNKKTKIDFSSDIESENVL